MIVCICGVCKSEIRKNKNDPPGCNICGFGMQPAIQYVPMPYPVYPTYPYPWMPYTPSITWTNTDTTSSTLKFLPVKQTTTTDSLIGTESISKITYTV